MDRDVVMAHMMFEILCQFVEKEKPFEWFDTVKSHNAEDWKKLGELYAWWVIKYLPLFVKGEEEEEEQLLGEKLKELLSVRYLLWT